MASFVLGESNAGEGSGVSGNTVQYHRRAIRALWSGHAFAGPPDERAEALLQRLSTGSVQLRKPMPSAPSC